MTPQPRPSSGLVVWSAPCNWMPENIHGTRVSLRESGAERDHW